MKNSILLSNQYKISTPSETNSTLSEQFESFTINSDLKPKNLEWSDLDTPEKKI